VAVTPGSEIDAELAPDRDEILRVVQLYIDGFNRQDIDKFREAFHEDAWIFFTDDEGVLHHWLLEEHFEDWATGEPDKVGCTIISVRQAGDVANVQLLFDNIGEPSAWIDFHSLLRLDGAWKITNKTATHISRAGWAASEFSSTMNT